MNWELVINIISELVKDERLREEIYRNLIEESEDFNSASECLGHDNVFDKTYQEVYEEYHEDDDLVEDDGDDYDYDDP